MIRRLGAATVLLVLWPLGLTSAPETVRITLPASVTFAVTNVSANTVGAPNPTSIMFNQASLIAGHGVRISVKADSDFVPPSGTAIPASKVSWTITNAVQGVGSNGVLSTSAYGQVYQGNANKPTGSVNVSWTLAAPGTSVRAGNHTMTMRWKMESF